MDEGHTTLDELLDDPMVKLVMARDRVRPEELRRSIESAHRRAADKPAVPPAHVIAKTCQGLWICR